MLVLTHLIHKSIARGYHNACNLAEVIGLDNLTSMVLSLCEEEKVLFAKGKVIVVILCV